MAEVDRAHRLRQTLERLTKWRSVFAGWQLGTRLQTDPEAQAVRDHRDLSMLMRVEITALTQLLLDKGVFTLEELQDAMAAEAEALMHAYEARFPGFKATDHGLALDPALARETMKGWKP